MLLLFHVVLHDAFLYTFVSAQDIHYIVFFLLCISLVVVGLYILDIAFYQTFFTYKIIEGIPLNRFRGDFPLPPLPPPPTRPDALGTS